MQVPTSDLMQQYNAEVTCTIVGKRERAYHIKQEALQCGVIWEIFHEIARKFLSGEYFMTNLDKIRLFEDLTGLYHIIKDNDNVSHKEITECKERIQKWHSSLKEKDKKKLQGQKKKKEIAKKASLGNSSDQKQCLQIYNNILNDLPPPLVKSHSGKGMLRKKTSKTTSLNKKQMSKSMPTLPKGKKEKLIKTSEIQIENLYYPDMQNYSWETEEGVQSSHSFVSEDVEEETSWHSEEPCHSEEVKEPKDGLQTTSKLITGDLILFDLEKAEY